MPHDTTSNKWDKDIGVTTIGPHWKYGRVRLPGLQGNPGRTAAAKLVSEVTRFRKDGRPAGTDDQVMANWFLEVRLPEIKPRSKPRNQPWRPTWWGKAA